MQSQTDLHNELTYTDSELDFAQSESYLLDVCIAEHRISYTIHANTRVLGLKTISVKVNMFDKDIDGVMACFQLSDWVNYSYKEIRVFIAGSRFTLVPEALFEADKAATYLNLVHKNTNYQVLTSKVADLSAVCVFGLPDAVYSAIRRFFTAASIYHQTVILLKVASQFSSNDIKNHLLVNINEGFISVLYAYNTEVKFLNIFETSSDTDMVYYILSVANLLKLPADKFGVILSGNISSSSSTISLMKKYIPEVLPINRLENIQYPVSFREFQEHQHYLPIHSLLCE